MKSINLLSQKRGKIFSYIFDNHAEYFICLNNESVIHISYSDEGGGYIFLIRNADYLSYLKENVYEVTGRLDINLILDNFVIPANFHN